MGVGKEIRALEKKKTRHPRGQSIWRGDGRRETRSSSGRSGDNIRIKKVEPIGQKSRGNGNCGRAEAACGLRWPDALHEMVNGATLLRATFAGGKGRGGKRT